MSNDLFDYAKDRLKATEIRFDGPEIGKQDTIRLTGQLLELFNFLKKDTEEWWTLRELAANLRYPEASISANLRNLRKERFGSHIIEKRNLGYGLWEYRLVS